MNSSVNIVDTKYFVTFSIYLLCIYYIVKDDYQKKRVVELGLGFSSRGCTITWKTLITFGMLYCSK